MVDEVAREKWDRRYAQDPPGSSGTGPGAF